jgi:hypothetical protein
VNAVDERILNSPYLPEDDKRAYLAELIAHKEEMLALSIESLALLGEMIAALDQQEFDALLWESEMLHHAW